MKFALVPIVVLYIIGIGLQLFAPNTSDVSRILETPSLQHLWGTDSLGRDLLVRSLQGYSFSLTLAIVASAIGGSIGVSVGAFAGWKGGRTDLILMRILEILEALPDLLLAIVLALVLQAIWGTNSPLGSFVSLSLALGFCSWFELARQARVLTLRERQMLYADAAVALGASRARILGRHIWPNIQSSIWILILLQIPGYILFEAALSFFGFGIQAPSPSLGQLFVEGWRVLPVTSHVVWGPITLLFLTLITFRSLQSVTKN